MTPKSITHSPVPHHCLGPGRAAALGHGAEAAPTSTGAYRRMFPDLPSLPSDEAFLHELGTSCGAEVSGFGANGKDDASGAAGWAFFGQVIAHDVTADRSPLMDRADIEALKNVRRQKLNLEFLYGSGPTGDPYRVSRPDWRPELPSRVAGRFTMADLLGFVGETRGQGRTPEQVRP